MTNNDCIEKKIERIVKTIFPCTAYVDLNGGNGTKEKPYYITIYAYNIDEDFIRVEDGNLGKCELELTKQIAKQLINYGFKNIEISLEERI